MTREEINATELCDNYGLGVFFSRLLENFALEMVRRHNEECANAIPTSWLDPLLSGPMKAGEFTASIEALLLAIKQRVKEAKP